MVTGAERQFTAEQLDALRRRDGDLLLDASAGSGKTSVLVERFALGVLEDGIPVEAILAITFTEKAAAELRDRIRARLREAGADEAARATEGAFISTIHGFCARVLRAHALSAGIDPLFTVLDEPDARRLADAAFDDALEELAGNAAGAIELISAWGPGALRGATLGVYGELRARGQLRPHLPQLGPAPDLERTRTRLADAASALALELGALVEPGARVLSAIERVGSCSEVLGAAEPWPGELDALKLPGGNGAALSTPLCEEYGEALASFRIACGHVHAAGARDLLDRLLGSFGERYAARKRAQSGLDFEDLELMTHELLTRDPELRERYRARFQRVMVDELQDTNAVQLELIDLIADGNLFCVGDAQQSIYGFRYADVELFEARAREWEQRGERLSLRVNFRSRPEILDVLNAGFESALGDRFRPLVAGRGRSADGDRGPSVSESAVELIVADRGADWGTADPGADVLAAPWRLAEARALAAHVSSLLEEGWRPADVVLLTRATTDLRTYERALEDAGLPTYVIGGRGYWGHPQVIDLVAYLRALANPLDEEALYTVLCSPLVGISLDALVLVSAAAREAGRDPWWLFREPEGRLDSVAPQDRELLDRFVSWFAAERRLVGRAGVAELINRALSLTGYDLVMLAMPGGARRLANVRKLMRLGSEHESNAGFDLRGFLDVVRSRSSRWGGRGARESEAPVEGEALDAVRLMTIHRAKGLEFPVVCVADLARRPWRDTPLIRVGRDGRLGLRLSRPGTAGAVSALAYDELGEEQVEFELEEERRLVYVAMTRACQRLVLSGAARLQEWPEGGGDTPMGWIGPAFADVASRVEFVGPEEGAPEDAAGRADSEQREGEVDAGQSHPEPGAIASGSRSAAAFDAARGGTPAAVRGGERPASLSYSAVEAYRRCGYRFYVERVLGVPGVEGVGGAGPTGALAATERGVLAHALLERVDFRRPVAPDAAAVAAAAEVSSGQVPSFAEADELATLIAGFMGSEIAARLGRCTEVRSEEHFGFLLEGELLITGVLDVLAREPGSRMLVVDYKSDRLEGAAPEQVVADAYETQRVVYALAALRAGAREVEVLHVFLEAPERPVVATFSADDAPRLEADLLELSAGIVAGHFEVTESPHRGICNGCPAEGGLCSWPIEMTRRDLPDPLF